MRGYTGKILKIDLNKRNYEVEKLSEHLARKLIGGKGFGAYYLYKLTQTDIDVFSPENPLILAAGPLNGTRVPMTSKVGFFFKSPLTNGYGESIVGGSLPKYPKWVGYDVIIFLGKAEKPTYIVFGEDDIEFRDANYLWGETIDKTDESLRKEFGSKASIVAIGPAGENMVRFAAIGVDKWRQAGRAGGGAVMGSKNLKALVFVSDDNWIEAAKPEELQQLVEEIIELRKKSIGAKRLNEYGTAAMAALANETGFFPSLYWTQGFLDGWENIGPDAVKSILRHPYGCWYCFISCGRYVSVDTKCGRIEIDGPEYETIYAIGGLFGIRDLGGLVYLNYLADIYGMDTITLGNVLGFAVEAYRKGKIDYKIEFGDVESAAELIKMIAYRKGIGNILADGVARAAKVLGLEDIAIHVKGMEPAGYEPRTLKGMSLAYAVSPRGACHLRMMAYYVDIRGLAGPPDELSERKIAKLIEFEDFMTAFDSLMICKFGRDIFSLEIMWKLLNAVTGFDISYEEFRKALERITLLTRLFNEREGFDRERDNLPERFFREQLSFKNQVRKLEKEEFERALEIYYKMRGIRQDGRISEEKKKELELCNIL